MKKVLLFGVLLAMLSCKKDKQVAVSDGLIGSWEFRGVACFCAPGINTLSTGPGNGNLLDFYSNNTYKRFQKTQLVKNGTYLVVKETFYNTPVNRIIYDNDTTTMKTFFKIENNKLTFYGTVPLAADGSEEYYARQ
jgi:hypothetical protein